MRIAPLNRKLLRDLLAMKGQALAIAMVVAAGVAMYVMYLSTFDSLYRTRDAYYERQRFGDVFASMKRAPQRVADEIAAIPNVSAVETRVVSNVTLDLEGLNEPASGTAGLGALASTAARQRSLPAARALDRARTQRRGAGQRRLRARQPARAGRSRAGGAQRAAAGELTIVGVALSPEFIYNIRPGELVPDDRRFGTFWMDEQALAAAFDMEGGFNDLVLKVAPGASIDEVIARVDRILEPYGGLGAIPRALQLSHWTVQNELSQLQTFGVHAADDLHDGGRVHPQRRADPGAGAATAADRRAQGPWLRQPRDRLALSEVGAGDRPGRCRHRRRARRDDGQP